MRTLVSLICLVICLVFVIDTHAQKKPNWFNADARARLYPKKDYLLGMSTEYVKSKKQLKEITDACIQYAKVQLVESIQVSLQSTTSYNVENVDTDVKETFAQNISSSSMANIIGLKVETYYSNTNRKVTAFAYAKKSDIISYYEQAYQKQKLNIQTQINEVKKASEIADIPKMLSKLYQAYSHFYNIVQTERILSVLERKNTHDEIIQLKKEIEGYEEKIPAIQNHIKDIAYVLAYGIYKQFPKKQKIFIGHIDYSYYGLESIFSQKLSSQLRDALIQFEYIIQKEYAQDSHMLSGRYLEEGGKIKVLLELQKSKEVFANKQAYLNLTSFDLTSSKVSYLPEAIVKANNLKNISLSSNKKQLEIKFGKTINQAVHIQVHEKDNQFKGLPIVFVIDHKEVSKSYSNDSGQCVAYIKKIESSRKKQVLDIKLDVVDYLNVPKEHILIKEFRDEVPRCSVELNVEKIKIYISSDERNLGMSLPNQVIQSKVREKLSKSYDFVDELEHADIHINITSDTRKGPTYKEKFFFSYLDNTISIQDRHLNREIFNKSFDSVKGGGANFELAGMQAYKLVVKKIPYTKIKNKIAE